jgi:precorrin-2/cobalt-factor-2 C20-methyltransferase
MKIGNRMKTVLDVLNEMGIAEHCAFASRLGLAGEVISVGLSELKGQEKNGYLSTMLIRKTALSEASV